MPASSHFQSIKVLDHGEVTLVASSASDLDVINGARVSFGKHSDELQPGDDRLIHFLMREKHGTPFEHNFFKFRIKAPIFVFREWHRHRVGHSYNEMSARYTELPGEWYIPDVENIVGQVGKPGAYNFVSLNGETPEIVDKFREDLMRLCVDSYDLYLKYIEQGVAKQQARLFLHVNHYSEMIWSCNARSLMHFLALRNSPQAQHEIAEYARAIERIFMAVMPITHAAFVENGRTAP